MGAFILSLDSMRRGGAAVHGSIHSLIGFNEKGGPTTHHGSIHSLIHSLMGTLILSLDSVRKEGPATHHGSIHSLVGFNERGGRPTYHGNIHFLLGLNEKRGP